jgi:hypothetical protein
LIGSFQVLWKNLGYIDKFGRGILMVHQVASKMENIMVERSRRGICIGA